jgi:hypothetical protein
MLRILVPAVLLVATLPLSAQEPIQHAPDGGTMERIQSLDIPAIANAPFTAVVLTEVTRILPDGSKQTTWNHRNVARNSAGQVFEERRYFSPHGDTQETLISERDYQDPNLHELVRCSTFDRTCRTDSFNLRFTPPSQDASLPPSIKLPNGVTILRESLGHNTIQGVDCIGSRETTTIPAGLIGNEKPESIVKEFWYAPQLGVNVVTRRSDPRVSSIQNFTVTKLQLTEPDPSTFTYPANFTLIPLSTR